MSTNALLKAKMEGMASGQLVEALELAERQLSAQDAEPSLRLVRSWLITELEKRFPAASAHIDRLFQEAEALLEAGGEYAEVDYAGQLAAAVRRAM
jgi:hypothetical protein